MFGLSAVISLFVIFFVFFFKKKTAYELRISDWSSDVCSSDLPVLVHAAAGGVGLILVQWLKAVGATVIGTVSTEAKEQAARDAGADHVIRYRNEDVAAHVREITDGQGVPVTFDGIGMATWEVSLKATARRGLIVSYGTAGGPVSGVDLGVLARHGSQFVTRQTLFDYYLDPGERTAGAARVFEMIGEGKVAVTVGQRYG